MRTLAIVLTAILGCGPVAYAQSQTLEQILSLLDKTGPTFRDMTATLVRTDYTPVLKETEQQRGVVRMKRTGPRDIRMYVEFREPDQQIIVFDRNEAQKYYPKLNLVEIYDLGKYRSLKDQFLLLGFGMTGKELQKSYAVKLAGSEQIAGQQCAKLELVPRSKDAQEMMRSAELWISPAGHPVQQKIYTSSVQYTFTYTNIRLNSGLPDAELRLQVPRDAKRQRMLR